MPKLKEKPDGYSLFSVPRVTGAVQATDTATTPEECESMALNMRLLVPELESAIAELKDAITVLDAKRLRLSLRAVPNNTPKVEEDI